jgi:hypothetical protein
MIIGLSGAKGSGKDAVAKILVENYNYKRIAFADKLKESAAALLDLDIKDWESLKNEDSCIMLYGEDGNAFGALNFRTFLQRYGAEAHRDVFGPDFWVDYALKGINPISQDYVVTDCRFENEINKIHSFDGVIVRIQRDGVDVSDTHVSEIPPQTHLIDYFFDNNGTLEDIELGVDDLIEEIKYAHQDEFEDDI